MSKNLLKVLPLAAATLVASSAFGAMEASLDQQMKQVRTMTEADTYGAKTADATFAPESNGFSLSVDLLYWYARIGGTDYVYTDDNLTSTLPLNGNTQEIDFDWDFGFRIGAGYQFDHDCWDVKAVYTYFESSGDDSTNAGLNSSLIPLKGTSFIIDGTDDSFTSSTKATSQLNFDYDDVQLDLGRAFFVSRYLSFRPSFGLKGTWIDFTQTSKYSGGNQAGQPDVNTVTVSDEDDFSGMGIVAGLSSNWYFGKGFSIFGNLASAMVYGNHKITHKEEYSANVDNKIRLFGNMHRWMPSVDYGLGVAYQVSLEDKKQAFEVSLGFEGTYIWSANQNLQVNNVNTPIKYNRYNEDISMHGVTLHAKWMF